MKRRAGAAGVVLALVSAYSARARASAEGEGAWAAAPTSCVAEQFALRAYVTALRTEDVTSSAHDLARLPRVTTPLCRQAIENGRWPGLATELLPRVPGDPSLKKVICQLAPPEALSAIIAWESEGSSDARGDYTVDCAVALFHQKPDDFKRIVWPRLGAGAGRAVSPLAVQLASALRPDERLPLLPLLDFATETRAQGRDDLYALLCQHPVARAQAICQAPEVLEPQWAREARIKRIALAVGSCAGLALLFALAASLPRKFRRQQRR